MTDTIPTFAIVFELGLKSCGIPYLVIRKKTLDAKPKSIITIRFSFFAGNVLVFIEYELLLGQIFVLLTD